MCNERYVFNNICDTSPIIRRCLTRFSCVWDSCYFISDGIAETCSSFVQLKRCRGIRALTVEVRERMFEEFNRLACVDTFTAEDFSTMQEARDLLSLPLLSSIQMRPSKCSLGVTVEEKAKWVANVAALDAYMKDQLKQQKHVREQEKAVVEAKVKAKVLERARRMAQKQKLSRLPDVGKTTPASTSRPPTLLARAQNLFGFKNGVIKESLSAAPAKLSNRSHPALRPSMSKVASRGADWKVSQDKIFKRALVKRREKEKFPFMERINDLEDAYAGMQELFEVRAPSQPEHREGLKSFYKKYPVVVASLATTTTLSIVNSIALWNVLSRR